MVLHFQLLTRELEQRMICTVHPSTPYKCENNIQYSLSKSSQQTKKTNQQTHAQRQLQLYIYCQIQQQYLKSIQLWETKSNSLQAEGKIGGSLGLRGRGQRIRRWADGEIGCLRAWAMGKGCASQANIGYDCTVVGRIIILPNYFKLF